MSNPLESKINDAIERELEKHPEMNMTVLESIHHVEGNDAVRVARIAQNLYPLLGGFFDLIYDRIILEEMAGCGWVDIEGNKRFVSFSDEQEEEAKIVDGVLVFNTDFWEKEDIHSNQVKNYIARYCLGLHVKRDKLAKRHDAPIRARLIAEFTAYSQMMNKTFYSLEDTSLRAIAMTIVDLVTRYILIFTPNFCNDADIVKMNAMAYEVIVESMDTPSETPLIRAFNQAAASSLFLDERAAKMAQLFIATREVLKGDTDIATTLPLAYMARCATLAKFD